MPHDEYQRSCEGSVIKLEVARANVALLETEHDELEVALRVHARIAGDAGKVRQNGGAHKSQPSQEYLIFLILDGAIPNRLSVRDICKIAQDEHGREIPVPSAASILSSAKKEGRVINRDGTWSTNPDDSDTSGGGIPRGAIVRRSNVSRSQPCIEAGRKEIP